MDAEAHMKAAFAALLRGDLGERDRQCDLAKTALDNEKRAMMTGWLDIDFFVTRAGTVIPAVKMMARA